MNNYVLVKDAHYEGKYVALKSLLDRTVVASGDDPYKVREEAIRQGIDKPLVTYIPNKDMSFCY